MGQQKSSGPPLQIIKNNLPQSIPITVDGGNGPEEVKLPPYGMSKPFLPNHITEHTHGLAAAGHVSMRAAQ